MKVVCVSKFNYYDLRIKSVMHFFEQKGYNVLYLTGDYDTMNRQHYQLNVPNAKQIRVIPYYKNISFQRIYSHYQFAKAIYKQLLQEKPDVIYAMVPPNFMAHFIAKYKRQFPQTKVIFDVFDMWPETFPNNRLRPILALPFKIWEQLRTRGLRRANLVLAECELFTNRLQQLGNKAVGTLHPYQEENTLPIQFSQEEGLHICYLGSINNIIDIERITQFFQKLVERRRVTLHVIGNGEKKDYWLHQMRAIGVDVVDYGNVYDNTEKQKIFNRCAFGINILKESVYIGLTLKSIDYFNGGLPLLNTVNHDTAKWVDEYGAGINIESIDQGVEAICQLQYQDVLLMKQRARKVYTEKLSPRKYNEKIDMYLERICNE
ncbi:glycosyltransferase [Carnobacteriaceae bacterium zg-C25]|nr:glycosyltransferase [Carnobacteriaceae bacterium zg-C25]